MPKQYSLQSPDRVGDLLYAIRDLEEIQRELLWEIRSFVDHLDTASTDEASYSALLRG